MRRTAPLLLLLASLAAAAPADAAGPRRVRVALEGAVTLPVLLEGGFDVTVAKDRGWAELLEWPGDGARLAALGARTELLDEAPGRTAAERARAELSARPAATAKPVRRGAGPAAVTLLPPFGEGGLAGFWTLDEVAAKLDDLVASDTRDLVADRVDTLGWSVQGRPVLGLEVGLRVEGPDTRPVAFFNALTHCREPQGMQALFYFLDDLLATYDTDPVAKYLLDHRRLYFVPVVNPDGYAYNQRLYDSTGAFGYWRKNLRDNDASLTTNGADGVDLNRNFGFQWGYDNAGSSPTPSSGTYRGPAAFSEPETRAQRDVVAALQPVTGFSFHTYSDLFLHPWGHTTAGTPDSAKFQAWTDELTLASGYTGGPSPRVLYAVNGDFNDWTYGETAAKPRAYTWTPEIGGPADDFWPPPHRIVPLAQELVRPCRIVAGLAGPWVRAASVAIAEGTLDAGRLAHLLVRAENLGMTGSAGPSLQAQLTALDPAIEVLSGPVGYPPLASFQSADGAGGFAVAAADTITPGRLVRFRVDFTDAAGLHCRDTIEVVVGTPTVVYASDLSSTAGWTVSGGWGVRVNDATHPSAYFADSPGGRYASGMDARATLSAPLDLSQGVRAWAVFEDRWTFESNFDGAVLEASRDGATWTALATTCATTTGAASALGAGVAAFEGSRWRWAPDRADLSAFAGGPANTQVRLRFRSRADGGLQLDGLDLDSLRVLLYDPAAQPEPVAVEAGPGAARLALAPPSPNPARGRVRLAFDLPPGAAEFLLEVLDVQGRRVVSYAEPAGPAGRSPAGSSWRWGWDLHDGHGRRVAPGLYLVRLRSGADEAVRRVVVLP